MRARFVNEVNFERGGDPRDTLLGDYWRKQLHQEMAENKVWSGSSGEYNPGAELQYSITKNLPNYIHKILASNPELLKEERYLIVAVRACNIEVVKLLLDAGIDPEGKFNYPLRYAAEGKRAMGTGAKEKREKSTEIAKILVAAGAPTDGYSRGMKSDNARIIDQEFEFEIEDETVGDPDEFPVFTINADFYYDGGYDDRSGYGGYELDGYYLQKGSYDPKYKEEIEKYIEKNEKSIEDHMEENVEYPEDPNY